MAANELVAQGDRAFVDEDYGAAVEAYTQARARAVLHPRRRHRRDAACQPHTAVDPSSGGACVWMEAVNNGFWSGSWDLGPTPLRPCLQALKADPSSAKVYESRAHAHLKLEQYMEAAEDASKAIELDGGLAKAYLRKGWVSPVDASRTSAEGATHRRCNPRCRCVRRRHPPCFRIHTQLAD